MFLQSLRHAGMFRPVDGYFARAIMPARIGRALADRAFVRPLADALSQDALGRVTAFDIQDDPGGEPIALDIHMSLVTEAPWALDRVAEVLEALDAPAGSWVGNAECAEIRQFGRSHGLGLYLDATEAPGEVSLEIAEACAEELDGAGLYQGSAHLGDRTALYFYGDSFNRMRAALSYVLSTDPRCRSAYARRLN